MRILHVITSLRMGGAEKLIVDMVPLLQASGYQVDVLLFDGSETLLKKQLRDKGVVIYDLGYGGSVYNPLYLFKLIPFLRRYDIIHTHNTACQLFVAIDSLFCSSILITTEHNTFNRRRNWKWYKIIDRWMYSCYQKVACISDKAYNNLKDYLGTDKTLQTIYNGIDCEYFQKTCGDPSLKGGKTIITMVAGFRKQKDQDTLIRAMKYLPMDKFELWLVGDGERRSDLEHLTNELELSSVVRFWGIRSDVSIILHSSDIIVMSSHWEGLSLSSLEGMCVGKPFVASDVDGLHEIVEGYGILFPHQDEVALANTILHLENDPIYYQHVVDRCLKRAKDFDIKSTVKEYLKVYEKALS